MNEPDDDRLLDILRLTQVGRHEAIAAGALAPELALLREWQSARLARSHADLLADLRYAPACRFFLADVYAARDFTQRDHDISRIYHSMRRVLPPEMRRSLELVMELNIITTSLDHTLLIELLAGPDGAATLSQLSVAEYTAAYRRCANYDERRRQIELIGTTGRAIDRLVHRPAVGLALRLARGPALLGGWHELQDFLERGYHAFRHMKAADRFLEIITGRELLFLDRIFAGEPEPFTISAEG
jgi:hypothetical protein